ncbi:MAG TPA: hypothetical protein PLN21_16220 [Gemmatales bacterium]|nr:hypothetical protein [Gemmatales bacterium]
MNPHHPRLSRARPRLNYAPHSMDVAKEKGQRSKRRYSGYGVLYIRCGGGWRVLRRDYLPGDERG